MKFVANCIEWDGLQHRQTMMIFTIEVMATHSYRDSLSRLAPLTPHYPSSNLTESTDELILWEC